MSKDTSNDDQLLPAYAQSGKIDRFLGVFTHAGFKDMVKTTDLKTEAGDELEVFRDGDRRIVRLPKQR